VTARDVRPRVRRRSAPPLDDRFRAGSRPAQTLSGRLRAGRRPMRTVGVRGRAGGRPTRKLDARRRTRRSPGPALDPRGDRRPRPRPTARGRRLRMGTGRAGPIGAKLVPAPGRPTAGARLDQPAAGAGIPAPPGWSRYRARGAASAAASRKVRPLAAPIGRRLVGPGVVRVGGRRRDRLTVPVGELRRLGPVAARPNVHGRADEPATRVGSRRPPARPPMGRPATGERRSGSTRR
jgi:hypothetical protein